MKLRGDLEGERELFSRLDAIAQELHEYETIQWLHYRYSEDFDAIYGLREEVCKPLEQLYYSGREMAGAYNVKLTSYNRIEKFPTLSSFVEEIEALLQTEFLESKKVIENTKRVAFENHSDIPYAISPMLCIFETQIRLLESLKVWLTMAKNSKLYLMENGIMNEAKSDQARYHIQNFQGVLGNVINSTLKQDLHLKILKDDFSSIESKRPV